MQGKLLAMVLALAMVFGLMPAMSMPAKADDTLPAVSYLKPVVEDGNVSFSEMSVNEYTLVSSSVTAWSAGENLRGGWYVVSGDVTISKRITVSGDVHLILTDDCTLNATGGISVPNGTALNIYAQAGGTGILTAQGAYEEAGIGGNGEVEDEVTESGTIVISGGNITATGGDYGAGIGGGSYQGSGWVTILGGTVTAVGGKDGAGIGGGESDNGTDVTILGGTVTATGGTGSENESGSGIGSGTCGTGGTVSISGGTITATAAMDGAGIGTTANGSRTTVSISGGTITASSSSSYGYGINGGADGSITINGGGIIAKADNNNSARAAINVSGSGQIEISGGRVSASANAGDAISGSLFLADGIGVYDNADWSGEPYQVADFVETRYPAMSTGRHSVSYEYPTVENGEVIFETKTIDSSEFNIPKEDQKAWSGCYVFDTDMTINSQSYCDGAVSWILCDGCEVTISGRIQLGQSTSLTIYGQSGGTGTMNIIGTNGPGISTLGGTATINGGIINAAGSVNTAAIGGASGRDGGTITINGGTVTATGGQYGAGIGGGSNGGGGTITINGGTVRAIGGQDAAGIGGSYNGSGGTVTINGGDVYAEGSTDSAGIGSSYNSSFDSITVNGGTVKAVGGSRAAGIGCGYSSSVGTITINGGSVTAYSVSPDDWYDEENAPAQGIGVGVKGNLTGTLTLKEGVAVYTLKDVNDYNSDWSEEPYQVGGTVTDRYPYMHTAILYELDAYGNKFYEESGQPEAVNTVLNNKKISYQVINASESDPQVTVKGLVNQSATSVGIPATIDFHGVTYKVTKIKASAFKANTKIKKVSVGANVTSIGHYAFKDCTALASVTGCKSVKIIGKQAFCGCTSLAGAAIGSKVTTIYDLAFYKCSALTKIVIPATTTKIGKKAFYCCTSLAAVTLGSKVATISDLAFYKCTALTKITIPAATKTIGQKAFMGCKYLKTVVIKTTKLTTGTVGAYAFKSINSKAVVKVPKAKLSAYKTLLKKRGITGANQTIKGF